MYTSFHYSACSQARNCFSERRKNNIFLRQFLLGLGEGCSSLIIWSSFSSKFLIASLVPASVPMHWLQTIVASSVWAWTLFVQFVILAPFAWYATRNRNNAAKSQCLIVEAKWDWITTIFLWGFLCLLTSKQLTRVKEQNQCSI